MSMAKKNRSKIKIKKENRGTFTAWCKSHGFDSVTAACIALGKKSKNAKTRRRATFAANARRWKK